MLSVRSDGLHPMAIVLQSYAHDNPRVRCSRPAVYRPLVKFRPSISFVDRMIQNRLHVALVDQVHLHVILFIQSVVRAPSDNLRVRRILLSPLYVFFWVRL